jgi:hypothetical protein
VISTRFGRVAAMAALLSLSGCAGNELGTLGNVLGGVLGPATGGPQQGQQGQGQVLAEVQGVDAQQQAIHLRTDRGQSGVVLFDRNTVVVYRQQQYPVTALERGDVVAVQVQQLDRNRLYTPRIDVQQSVQERTGRAGAGAQLRQIAGRVGRVDQQRGMFEMQTQQGTFTVVLPPNPGAATMDYFRRLRSGLNVTIEGTMTGRGRIDLYRFV